MQQAKSERTAYSYLLHLLAGFLFLLQALPLHAAASAQTEHVTVSLLSSSKTLTGENRLEKSEPLWLGIQFNLIPHWHIYWKNPGDSGEAPKIRLELPEGMTAGEIHWPIPEKIPVGPLMNIGYQEQVTLLIPISIKPGFKAFSVQIKAHLSWLVCKESCIPEKASLDLSFPLAGNESLLNLQQARAFLPDPWNGNSSYLLTDDNIKLLIEGIEQGKELKNSWFVSNEWGLVSASAAQNWQIKKEILEMNLKTGDLSPAPDSALAGLLVLEYPHSTRGVEILAAYSSNKIPASEANINLILALLFAFIGGLILNLMPCVLPILSIKVLGFLQLTNASKTHLSWHGWSFSFGVFASFIALAALLLIFRAGGEALGWGFQLQSPVVVAFLAAIMLIIALNFSGVFEFTQPALSTSTPANSAQYTQSFLTGVLAVIVASPCTAPFMGVAMGFAMTQPAVDTLFIFLSLGLGFALPILLLSIFPGWLKYIPKPGGWMIVLRQFLSFPMFATVAWLTWVISQQISMTNFAFYLSGLILVALAVWLFGKTQSASANRLLIRLFALLIFLLAFSLFFFEENEASKTLKSIPWSTEKVAELKREEKPFFVNFTAAWCITCKVNEQVVLQSEAIKQLIYEKNIVYLKADWTNKNSEIERVLSKYQRSGVPLYLLFIPGREEPLILPQLLTRQIVIDAFSQVTVH
jgi:thiol:disulfide interchange protein DsbD